MNPERKDRMLIAFQSLAFRDSLVSNVAVSIPVIYGKKVENFGDLHG
eukprot:gene35112-45450_t